MTPRGPLAVLGLLAAILPGSACTYLADRALDFADQFRATIGAGTVVGARVRSGGTFETGLMIGVKPRAAALGWLYGTPLYFAADPRMDAEQAEIVRTTTLLGHDFRDGSYRTARTGICVLPAVFSWVDSSPTDYEWLVPAEGGRFDDRHWIWSAQAFRQDRWQQVHAFDVETEIGLFVHAGFGYSPGELIDFLLGLFTIDLAGDDGRLGGA